MEVPQDLYITKDKSALNIEKIQEMLKETYWAQNRTLEEIKATVENSRCYGLFLKGEQIGFARVLSDTVVFAYLMDVLIHKSYQGKGYSKILLDKIFNDPEYKAIHRWNLNTKDAHGLYKQFDFKELSHPETFLEKVLVNWR